MEQLGAIGYPSHHEPVSRKRITAKLSPRRLGHGLYDGDTGLVLCGWREGQLNPTTFQRGTGKFGNLKKHTDAVTPLEWFSECIATLTEDSIRTIAGITPPRLFQNQRHK